MATESSNATIATPVSRQSHRQWVLNLVEQYEQPLVRYACRLTGDVESARDVVQHTLVRLCSETPETIASPRAWLYTVCHHRALDIRRQAIRVVSLDGIAHDTNGEVNSHNDSPSPQDRREPDPAEAAELRDSSQLLQRIVDLLPEKQRQAVHLWAEGFDYREISAITGRSTAYVGVLMHRAIKQIRKHPLAKRMMNDECGTMNEARSASKGSD